MWASIASCECLSEDNALVSGVMFTDVGSEGSEVTTSVAALGNPHDVDFIRVDVIKGAVNINFKSSDLTEKISKLDNQRAYIVHCRSGSRSSQALPVLKKNNFGKIHHLNQGFNAWKSAEMPVER
jgi:rhodanese-related sulfurtransferase